MNERLQKILAHAGLCSRREAEKWIQAGRVRVNGQKETRLGTKVDPSRDQIQVDGKPLKTNSKKVYYLFHKPRNVMVTGHDPKGRPTIQQYLSKIRERVYPVGRLDFDSEGLIVLTNDGELTYEVTHPKSRIPKTYEIKISGLPKAEDLSRLEKELEIDGEKTKPCGIKFVKKTDKNCWLKMILIEGKQRQIRAMLEGAGHRVMRLRRVAVGPFQLGDLKPGEYRKVYPK